MLWAGIDPAGCDSMAPLERLDGRSFRQAVGAGTDWVRHTREQINRINEFPVPDGDTGTSNEPRRSFDVVELIPAPATGVVGPMPVPALGGSSTSGSETTIPWLDRGLTPPT
jgi:hypothetical protein